MKKLERLVDRGYLEHGTSLRSCWAVDQTGAPITGYTPVEEAGK